MLWGLHWVFTGSVSRSLRMRQAFALVLLTLACCQTRRASKHSLVSEEISQVSPGMIAGCVLSRLVG